ncbi:hypothetical protein [Thiosulfatihalobacter marinus]|uniref:hypothetical protein n=1 Tax=Thiosulfatihalobacter marinus TaxID=2792481 RepID=UPI0018DA26A5|nr:hypothetical protein [Thiosulfatihalobacter marinus]
MKKLFALVASLTVLGACEVAQVNEYKPIPLSSSLYAKAQAAVKKDLLDPESANFKDPYAAQFTASRGEATKSGVIVCGYVNAKNRMGGYVGYTPYGVIFQNGKVVSKDVSDSTIYDCQKVGYNPS